MSHHHNTDKNRNGIPDNMERLSINEQHHQPHHHHYDATTTRTVPMVQQVVLPTQIVEKPIAVHEEIRRERVEEIQPVVNVEKLKTEIHQVTQPLFDKEVKVVNVSRAVLNSQVLPEVHLPGHGYSQSREVSTVNYRDTASMTVEKPAIYVETDKKQIIEEIQPILYKETIIPTVIQETKPIYQKIVEGPTYIHETLPGKSISSTHYTYSTVTNPTTFTEFNRDASEHHYPHHHHYGTTTSTDLNANGIPDNMERRTQFVSTDQNRNGIPDNMERTQFSGTQMNNDQNRNGIPDNMERRNNDLNNNGIPDQFERRQQQQPTMFDRNGNRIPDVLEQKIMNPTTTNTTNQPTSRTAL